MFNAVLLVSLQCVRNHQAEGVHELGDWHHGLVSLQLHSKEPKACLRSVNYG